MTGKMADSVQFPQASHATPAQVAWDDDYVYVRASSGWKRLALAVW